MLNYSKPSLHNSISHIGRHSIFIKWFSRHHATVSRRINGFFSTRGYINAHCSHEAHWHTFNGPLHKTASNEWKTLNNNNNNSEKNEKERVTMKTASQTSHTSDARGNKKCRETGHYCNLIHASSLSLSSSSCGDIDFSLHTAQHHSHIEMYTAILQPQLPL